MLSSVAQGLKPVSSSSGPDVVSAPNEALKRILDHAKTSGLVDQLCLCLATSGTSLISGSSNMLRTACEACRAIWSLTDALEILYMKENTCLFPLTAMQSHSLLRLNISDQERGSLVRTETVKVVDIVTKAFLRSKAVQVAIHYCIHQRLEVSLSASIQVLLSPFVI